jgi:hypothetical protein
MTEGERLKMTRAEIRMTEGEGLRVTIEVFRMTLERFIAKPVSGQLFE